MSIYTIRIHFGGKIIPFEGQSDTVEALLLDLIEAGHLGDATLEELFVFEEDSDDEIPHHTKIHKDHKRLHIHRCRHVRVTFLYMEQQAEESFRPSATIRRLMRWAKGHFNVEQQDKYELRLGASADPLPLDAHVGSYVEPGTCSVTMYFVPAKRIQG